MRSRTSVVGLACLASLAAAGAASGAVDPGAASGMGFTSWWAAHGEQTIAAIGCFVDGAALATLFVGGITGVGGVVAAAGLVVAGLVCISS
jgi:hypothetical protein